MSEVPPAVSLEFWPRPGRDPMKDFWLIVGLVGQAMFSARFVIQWLASERAHRSVVPTLF